MVFSHYPVGLKSTYSGSLIKLNNEEYRFLLTKVIIISFGGNVKCFVLRSPVY